MLKAKRPYPHYKFPHEIEICYKQMTEKECDWYGVPTGSYDLRCTNYGWFPTGVLATVVKGKYTDGHGIGLSISGNMGSAAIAVTDLNGALKLLHAAGYRKVKPA